MELADHRVPTGITGGNALWRNGGQAVEAGLRAVQVSFGDRAVEGVQRRRRDAIERVLQFGHPSPIGIGEGRRAAVLPGVLPAVRCVVDGTDARNWRLCEPPSSFAVG